MSQMLNSALWYAGQGMSVFPTGRDKKPLIKWEKYQKERATEAQIKEWWVKFPDANIGIVTGAISGIMVVDIDTEEGHDEIQKYIPESLETPTANTPKGGQHLFFKLPKGELRNNCRTIPGCDLRGEGGYVLACPSVNGNGKGYTWTLSPKLVSFAELPQAYINKVNKPVKVKPKTITEEMFTEGRRDNDLFHIANVMSKGGAPVEEINQVLIKLMASWGEHDEQWAMAKSQSAIERLERKERNIHEEVRGWLLLHDGYINVTTCYNELQFVTKEQKTSVRVALHRLQKEGKITRHPSESGKYKTVNEDCDIIKWWESKGDYVPIRFPMDIHSYCHLYPKNIAVVAGAPNTGKSAFLLDFCRLNMNSYKIRYLSSEMVDNELSKRLQKFAAEHDMDIEEWKKIDFRERSRDFADVIDPDNITVIDYLECNVDFYMMGQWIKDIFDKLKKGICLIAIQKKPGDDNKMGRGGLGTLEKPRLYLSMDNGKISIVKGKNWAIEGVNPNGLEKKFALIQGSKFIDMGTWEEGKR